MYFESRAEAGMTLAQQLNSKYRYEDCAVLALNAGGVLVGEPIATTLHSVLTLLITEDIEVPGENVSFGAVSQDGNFTYNSDFSSGEIDAYTNEFHGYLEEEKRKSFQKINRLLGDGGTIDKELLRNRTIIIVSDSFDSVSPLNAAVEFLKPIRTNRLIMAAPIATLSVVDYMHVAADELHVLDIKTNYLGANHYFEDNSIPSREETITRINQIILNWR